MKYKSSCNSIVFFILPCPFCPCLDSDLSVEDKVKNANENSNIKPLTQQEYEDRELGYGGEVYKVMNANDSVDSSDPANKPE